MEIFYKPEDCEHDNQQNHDVDLCHIKDIHGRGDIRFNKLKKKWPFGKCIGEFFEFSISNLCFTSWDVFVEKRGCRGTIGMSFLCVFSSWADRQKFTNSPASVDSFP